MSLPFVLKSYVAEVFFDGERVGEIAFYEQDPGGRNWTWRIFGSGESGRERNLPTAQEEVLKAARRSKT